MNIAQATSENTQDAGRFLPEHFEQSIVDRFVQQVSRFSDRPAVISDEGILSYRELDQRTDALARRILTELGPKPCAVAMLLDQGSSAVAAILGILKAGKWFVPLDPDQSHDVILAQLEHSEARLILGDESTQSLASRLAGSIQFPDVRSMSHDRGNEVLLPESTANDLACVFYTSGSTGSPKGVMDIHRNVLHNIYRYTHHLQITHDDRLSLIQPCAFSGTVSSLFGALLNGAAVCPYSLRRNGISGLASWARERRLTIFHSVPLIFRGMLRSNAWFPDVRVVRLEGDRALSADLELFKKHFPPRSVLSVGLGATETGLSRRWRAVHTTYWPEGGLPVGYKVDDVDVSIRDEHGISLPNGETGEIWVHSSYLSPGYWRDEQRTRDAFIVDSKSGSRAYRSGDLGCLRHDGCLEFKGRKGSRFKIRGSWVDAADVEDALLSLPGVGASAVVSCDDVHGISLQAFVVLQSGVHIDEQQLRSSLLQRLPANAVPSRFFIVDHLPRSRHHKIDRRALLERPSPPATSPAQQMLKIWRNVFGNANIGLDDDFFTVGGDSALAALICAVIADEMGVELPESVLRDHPTVARLAKHIRDFPRNSASNRFVALKESGTRLPLFLIPSHFDNPTAFADLADAMAEDQPVYACRLPRAASLPDMARTIIDDMRALQAAGPLHVAGYCYGGTVAWEIANQLIARGEEIGLLALLNVGPRELPGMFPPFYSRSFLLFEQMRRIKMLTKYLLRHDPEQRIPRLRHTWRRNLGARRSEEYRRLWSLQHDYVAKPLNCPVELFLPSVALGRFHLNARTLWKRISTADVHIHMLEPGDRRILTPPYVNATAVAITDALCRTSEI